MTLSAERQREFAIALLDPERPTPNGIVGPDGELSPRRFSIYRNNVVVGLTEILNDAFPAVRRLVGSEFFDAMAGVYVRADPPRSPILLGYGGGFPAFIETFSPAASVPYLADVARIEWAWKEAYHAEDASSLSASAFGEIPMEALPGIHLQFHPSLRVVCSSMPALTIWRMNVADGVPGPVTFDGEGEDVLVIRPTVTVEVRSLPPGAIDFIGALRDGRSVLEATEATVARDPRFDLSANIAGLIEAGAFVGYELDKSTSQDAERIAE